VESGEERVKLAAINLFQNITIILKFLLEFSKGSLYLLRSRPGANMERIPGHARLRIIIHEFVYGFKWRSHSPGSIFNKSNKRALALV
jgi:hypothetical protein